ncbi:MAG: DNA-directed RNA polymerase subunit omega [Ignavibacterium sp.]|uniref:DNA-directed RNA polymerase subunit omega n=1 Tax=Ignavibacterium sp. TaxID=2651167 RepID=UPI00404A2F72
MNISPVDLRQIDLRASNVYEAIIVAAKRARQLNDENKIEFNALINSIPQSSTDDDAEDVTNPQQLKLALEFEKREKPHLQALNELLEGKIEYRYKSVK